MNSSIALCGYFLIISIIIIIIIADQSIDYMAMHVLI